MANDGKKSWNTIAKGDDERLGVSRDMLKRLLEVNPNLRGEKNTEDVLKDVKGALKSAAKPTPAPAKSPAQHSVVFGGGGTDDTANAIVARVGELREELAERHAAIDAEIKKLQDKRAAETTRVREILVSLRQLEPAAFESATVKKALAAAAAWLLAIGFKVNEDKK